jgi:hypothetical protein
MKRLSLRLGLGLVLAVALAGLVAQTATSNPVDHPWTGSGSGTTTVVSDGTSGPAVFTYSDHENFEGSWTFSTVASQTRTVNLAWDYTGFHSFFQVTVGLDAFVTHGATTTTTPLVNDGPVDCCTPPSGGFSYSGTISLSVQAGDTYGFAMRGSHFDIAMALEGTLTVDDTDVTAPTVSCDLGVNPSGKNVPNANAGFRQVNASDTGGTGIVSLVITDGTFTSGQLESGDYIKLSVDPLSAGSDVRPGSGVLTAEITTSGQPRLVATDAAGNTASVPCGPLPIEED